MRSKKGERICSKHTVCMYEIHKVCVWGQCLCEYMEAGSEHWILLKSHVCVGWSACHVGVET